MSASSISNSKAISKFVLRIIAYISLNIVVLIPLYLNGREKATVESVYASVLLKHQLIVETKSPKIILAGASGTLFGYDSELLERLTGYPVVNLAITLQSGLFYILEEIKYYAHSGDIVIFAPEYHLFMKDQTDIRLIAELVTYDNEVINLVNHKVDLIVPIFQEIVRVIRLGIGSPLLKSNTTNPFVLADITSYGDLADECHTGQLDFVDSWANSMTYDEGYPECVFSSINQVSQFSDSMNIKFYIIFPAVTDSFYLKPGIALLAYRIRDEIDASFLGVPEGSVYEDSMFYNSIYHLNSSAAIVRTNDLYRLLKKDSCL